MTRWGQRCIPALRRLPVDECRIAALIPTLLIPAEFPGLAALARRSRYEAVSVEVLPGDVGRRRYLRLGLAGGGYVLGVFYPPEEEDARRRWLAARAHLRARVRVPALYAEDGAGNQILEDFGSEDLAARLASKPAERSAWLDRAADVAGTIAELSDPGINAAFDRDFFFREMDLAREAVFDLWLGESLDPGEKAAPRSLGFLPREGDRGPSPRPLPSRLPRQQSLSGAGRSRRDRLPGPARRTRLLRPRFALVGADDARVDDGGDGERGCRPVRGTSGARSCRVLASGFDRVLLQRAWKVCGTFARAVAQGKGDVYRRYLPGEIALVRRLLDKEPGRGLPGALRVAPRPLC